VIPLGDLSIITGPYGSAIYSEDGEADPVVLQNLN
jgi:hypothetical protein